ncbi:MAG: hypothetical protein IOD12_10430 [Silvanigrellales bacterium]|nr:hypothetical protein [Silvanigrellales bacterium]
MLASWNDCFPHWRHSVGLPEKWHEILGPAPRDEEELSFAQRVEALPKIELHVHAEAAVGEEFYDRLNALAGLYPPSLMPAKRAPFASFRDFINAWIDNSKLICHESEFEQLVFEFARDRASQNIVYSEAHVSPSDFSYIRERFPLGVEPFSLQTLLSAYARGARRAADAFPHIYVRFLVDALWIATPEEYERVLEALESVLGTPEAQDLRGGRFFVGVGLGGPESTERVAAIIPFLEGARKLGLGVDIHSGEMTSAEEHRRSIEALKPDRVGHGIRGAAEGFLFEGHITTCPLSNLLTGAHSGAFSTHAVARMAERGCAFSIGSDDPLLFRNTLTLEYVALRRVFGWDETFIHMTQAHAKKSAFDPEAVERAFRMSTSHRR